MNKLTEKQAYLAMIEFLDDYYEQTQSDEIGELLGSLQLLEDGKPADPAMWEDWLKSIEKISLEIART
ncbi:hypothetical protein [Crocosphaera sp.]|uniref:hypothetical protein n=1 Tax=Crocosphaera sp. TaxID=2729996 RepID=UPI002616ADB4|nr:hypothetical protein [Crocosphaera sp.]MDJ0580437.1 hypothetical protein [Crocosphaera sp.]